MGNQQVQSHFNEAYGFHEMINANDKTLIEKTYAMNSKY